MGGKPRNRPRGAHGALTPDKSCEQCGTTFSIRSDERTDGYRARVTCSKACSTVFRTNKLAKPTPDDKVCENCGTKFRKRAGEPPTHFRRRANCSRLCSRVSQGLSKTGPRIQEKSCDYCDKPFSKRAHEQAHRFLHRKTCSRKCGHALSARERKQPAVASVCVVCEKGFKTTTGRETCSHECWHTRRIALTVKSRHASAERYNVDGFDLTVPQIAELLELSVNTVKYRLVHGIDLFKNNRNKKR